MYKSIRKTKIKKPKSGVLIQDNKNLNRNQETKIGKPKSGNLVKSVKKLEYEKSGNKNLYNNVSCTEPYQKRDKNNEQKYIF